MNIFVNFFSEFIIFRNANIDIMFRKGGGGIFSLNKKMFLLYYIFLQFLGVVFYLLLFDMKNQKNQFSESFLSTTIFYNFLEVFLLSRR